MLASDPLGPATIEYLAGLKLRYQGDMASYTKLSKLADEMRDWVAKHHALSTI